jgi:multiple sugar transport system ATP-binding protein
MVGERGGFLFDAPLSTLDPKLRVTPRAELKRLHQRLRTTTIYVTHDQEEAMTLGDRIVVMKDGRVQQAAPPLETYNSPANRFVAGFVGMPPMNFLDGVIQNETELTFREGRRGAKTAAGPMETQGGELTLPANGFTLPVPARLRQSLAGHVGRHVLLGIRPEHLHLHNVAIGESSPLTLAVGVTEPLGNMMDVYMTTELDNAVIARVEAPSASDGGLRAGSRATLYVDLRRVHFFEPGETGMNLSRTSEPIHALA